jgi:hypothetical protein
MLDSHIVMLYTDALYSCPTEDSPTYNEFRDMFSRGQLLSKFWLVEELYKVHRIFDDKIIIVGSWFGTLGYFLRTKFVDVQVTCLDIDPRCAKFLDRLVPEYQPNRVQGVTGDMYTYDYSQDIVINTSCEHMPDVRSWLKKVPQGTLIALQSSNFKGLKEHMNCVNSVEEFKNQVGDEVNILYTGEWKFSMYTRYMVIGRKS